MLEDQRRTVALHSCLRKRQPGTQAHQRALEGWTLLARQQRQLLIEGKTPPPQAGQTPVVFRPSPAPHLSVPKTDHTPLSDQPQKVESHPASTGAPAPHCTGAPAPHCTGAPAPHYGMPGALWYAPGRAAEWVQQGEALCCRAAGERHAILPTVVSACRHCRCHPASPRLRENRAR